MKHWTIGNRGKRQTDMGLDDDTVSGLHASLTQTDDGRWIIEDRNSKNGTTRFIKGQWVPIRQAYVLPDERLRFGRAETTVHQLLALLKRSDQGSASGAVVSWRKDLAAAFPKIRDPAEFKRNILFVLDLILAPAEQIMQCAVRRRPVNPFSFMIFGGITYTVITTTGLTISVLLKMYVFKETAERNCLLTQIKSNLSNQSKNAILLFVLIVVFALISNVINFYVFKNISLKKRNFDDFMRLRAVVTGMFWMLMSFLALFSNEIAPADQAQRIYCAGSDDSLADQSFTMMVHTLSIVVVIYSGAFAVIANKHFWRISYGRTLFCYALCSLASVAFVFLIYAPISLMR